MVEVTVEAMSNAIQRTLSKQLNYSHTFTYGVALMVETGRTSSEPVIYCVTDY